MHFRIYRYNYKLFELPWNECRLSEIKWQTWPVRKFAPNIARSLLVHGTSNATPSTGHDTVQMVVIRVWIYIGEIGETPLDELANDRGKGNKLVIVGVWCMRSRYVRVVPIKLANMVSILPQSKFNGDELLEAMEGKFYT